MSKRASSLILTLLLGCAVERQAPAPPPPGPSRDALAVVRDGGDPVSSLRATFTARVERGDTTERARGVLLVRRPDRFRMRLSSLLGFTILDYTVEGDRQRLWLAGRKEVLSGSEIPAATSLSPAAVRWIFLRNDARLDHGCEERAAGSAILVECRDEGGVPVYRGYVRTSSGLLEREIVYEGQAPRLTVSYDDFRPIGGARLPHSIEWLEASTLTRVVIEVQRYEVNPDLPGPLFAG
jgi:hypothetical protein